MPSLRRLCRVAVQGQCMRRPMGRSSKFYRASTLRRSLLHRLDIIRRTLLFLMGWSQLPPQLFMTALRNVK